VKPVVEDLIGHLTRAGGEYFRQIVTEHGYVWPEPSPAGA